MERVVICAVCGKNFTTDKPRIKYCDDCRTKGAYIARKKWEQKTDYGRKQRDALREKRAKAVEEQLKLNKRKSQKAELARQKKEAAEKLQKEAELLRSAEHGDLNAKLELAFRNGGLFNPEYWKWYKALQFEYANYMGIECRQLVNGISVHDDNFEELVVESIKLENRVIRELIRG